MSSPFAFLFLLSATLALTQTLASECRSSEKQPHSEVARTMYSTFTNKESLALTLALSDPQGSPFRLSLPDFLHHLGIE